MPNKYVMLNLDRVNMPRWPAPRSRNLGRHGSSQARRSGAEGPEPRSGSRAGLSTASGILRRSPGTPRMPTARGALECFRFY